MALTGLHVLLTLRCDRECPHCFLSCGPETPGTMTLDLLLSAVGQGAGLGTVEEVWFEGGEPFLVYPLLVESVRLAVAAGFRTGIVTNGHWATDERVARLMLDHLRQQGLGSLGVSRDEHHRRDEDEPDTAAGALAAADALGIPAFEMTVGMPDDGLRLRGRAAENYLEGLPRSPPGSFPECPDEEFLDPGRIHLDPFGNVLACQGIILGNLADTSLAELVSPETARNHPIVGPLLRGGPAALAAECGLDPEPDGYASACHLCWRVRQALRADRPDALGPPSVYGA